VAQEAKGVAGDNGGRNEKYKPKEVAMPTGCVEIEKELQG
jgi:hypothetical protein